MFDNCRFPLTGRAEPSRLSQVWEFREVLMAKWCYLPLFVKLGELLSLKEVRPNRGNHFFL